MLQKLSLADNKLISCQGLEGLSALRELDISVRFPLNSISAPVLF